MGNSSGGKPLLIACGGCALLLVGLLLLSVGGGLVLTQGARNSVKAHVSLVKAGKVDEAYGVMSSGFKSSVSLEQFKTFVAGKDVLYQGDELKLTSRKVQNDEAQISGSTTKGDRTMEVRFFLRREEGAWRVSTIELGASTKPVVDAAKAHVKLVRDGKVGEAWAQTSQAFQKTTSEQAFADFVKRTGALYASKTLIFPGCRLNKDETLAEVTGKATGPDDKPYDVRLELRFEEEAWKVSLINVRDPALNKTPAKTEAPPAKTTAAKTGQ